jgi:hypothetical protein
MIEIVNHKRHPVQIMVRGRGHKSFTTLTIPGIGKGKNVCEIRDEQHTIYIDRIENDLKWITTRRVPNKLSKGE